MDIIDFIENLLYIKLTDVQKDFIQYLEDHPDAKIVFPRGRTTWLYNEYIIAKALLLEEK